MLSNPPGWTRAYANLKGQPLTVEGWQQAVTAGATFTTNGPWLEVDVAGAGLGDTVRLPAPTRLTAAAKFAGVGVDRLELVGPNGVVAAVENSPDASSGELVADLEVTESMWLAAVVRGGAHPNVLGSSVYAHTSPIWIELNGAGVARSEDAEWCINWLDSFETLARAVGNFREPTELYDLIDVVARVRVFYRTIVDRGSVQG
jgi:hypothetical protein